jgi:hypothetical protein
MHTTLRVMTGAAAAAILGFGISAPAHADPVKAKNSFSFQVVCDNGKTYDAISNGNGNFAPAHDLSGTAILIPVSFGEITFTLTDSDGNIIDQETQPPTAKTGAAAHNMNATTSCTFSGSSTEDGTTFTLAGSVRGFVTG